ncbi:hypothetical protein Avbf_07248, partial [Armadillidium vulgare]
MFKKLNYFIGRKHIHFVFVLLLILTTTFVYYNNARITFKKEIYLNESKILPKIETETYASTPLNCDKNLTEVLNEAFILLLNPLNLSNDTLLTGKKNICDTFCQPKQRFMTIGISSVRRRKTII